MIDEVSWLAGLLEGEGHFGADCRKRRGHDYCYPTVQLSMTDKDVVERAGEIMRRLTGSTAVVMAKKVYSNQQTKQWRIALYGAPAELLMQIVLPYMGERRTTRINEILHKRMERRNSNDEVRRVSGGH
jgi:hypothetical protein